MQTQNDWLPRNWRVRLIISLFILLNVCTIIFTNSPDFLLVSGIGRGLLEYGRWTRLMQRWSLFCPEPRRYTAQYFFELTGQDGSKKIWQRPYPPNWNYFERHHSYNWQKIDTASNHMEDRRLWPDMAEWVKRNIGDRNHPPTTIRLFVRLAEIPPPHSQGKVQSPQQDFVSHDQLIFTYLTATKEIK